VKNATVLDEKAVAGATVMDPRVKPGDDGGIGGDGFPRNESEDDKGARG